MICGIDGLKISTQVSKSRYRLAIAGSSLGDRLASSRSTKTLSQLSGRAVKDETLHINVSINPPDKLPAHTGRSPSAFGIPGPPKRAGFCQKEHGGCAQPMQQPHKRVPRWLNSLTRSSTDRTSKRFSLDGLLDRDPADSRWGVPKAFCYYVRSSSKYHIFLSPPVLECSESLVRSCLLTGGVY